jgi:broad specificity phosphatase PhoE
MPLFTFVRHAEALHNADHHARGDIAYRDPANRDAALTQVGIQQTRRELTDTYDIIYCSPLRRCRQTLLGIYPSACNRSVKLDDRLMEPQGDHTCNWRMEKAHLMLEIPSTWMVAGVADVNPGQQPRANETAAEFRQRIREWTEEVAALYPPRTRILVVTHYMWTRHWFDLFHGNTVGLANCEAVTTRWPPKKLTPSPAVSPVNSDNDNDG